MVQKLQDLGNTIYSRCYTEDKRNNKNMMLKEIVQMYQPETITTNDLIEDGNYYVYGSGGIIGKYNKYNHKESEVMISCRGLCGNVTLSLPKSWIIGNQMVMQFNNFIYKYYIFNYLKNIDLTKVETGSVQKQITRKNLEQLIINVPSEQILLKYSNIFKEIYFKINNSILETEKLKNLKSSLLPLLINGQLS